MNKSFYIIFLTLLITFSSCSPTINYLGNKYKPTTEVEIFFDTHDIKKDYKVIGVARNDNDFGLDPDDSESIQEAMIEKAKAVGANAIIFEGFAQEVETSRRSDTYHDKNSSTTISEVNTKKIYRAKFIKYNN